MKEDFSCVVLMGSCRLYPKNATSGLFSSKCKKWQGICKSPQCCFPSIPWLKFYSQERLSLQNGSQGQASLQAGGSDASPKASLDAFASLMNAIRASKNSLDIAKAMQSVKEERDQKNQESN